MKKLLAVCLCALLGVALLFVMAQEPPRPADSLNVVPPAAELSGPLMMQKSNLMKQRDQVQKEYTARIQGMGTVTLLFTQPDAVFMDIVAPLVIENNLQAMVAFDLETFPGRDGCITMAQWRQLEAAGWEICLKWDGKTLLPQWMEKMNRLLESYGIKTSLTVLAPEDLFTQDLLVQARQLNLKAVIHHGEDTGVKYQRTIQANDVWLPVVAPWHLDNTSDTVEKTVSEGGSMVLEVYNEIIWDGGYRRLFKSMLEKLVTWQNEDKLRVTTINEAIAYRQGVMLGSMALEEELKKHLDSLNVQIQEVDDQLNNLYPGT